MIIVTECIHLIRTVKDPSRSAGGLHCLLLSHPHVVESFTTPIFISVIFLASQKRERGCCNGLFSPNCQPFGRRVSLAVPRVSLFCLLFPAVGFSLEGEGGAFAARCSGRKSALLCRVPRGWPLACCCCCCCYWRANLRISGRTLRSAACRRRRKGSLLSRPLRRCCGVRAVIQGAGF